MHLDCLLYINVASTQVKLVFLCFKSTPKTIKLQFFIFFVFYQTSKNRPLPGNHCTDMKSCVCRICIVWFLKDEELPWDCLWKEFGIQKTPWKKKLQFFNFMQWLMVCSLNPIQDGPFWGCSGMGEGGRGILPPSLPKIFHTYPTMMKLGIVMPYLKKT